MLTRSAFCPFREKPAAAMLARPSRLAISPASRMAAVAALAIGRCSSFTIVSTKRLATSEMAKPSPISLIALQLLELALHLTRLATGRERAKRELLRRFPLAAPAGEKER